MLGSLESVIEAVEAAWLDYASVDEGSRGSDYGIRLASAYVPLVVDTLAA